MICLSWRYGCPLYPRGFVSCRQVISRHLAEWAESVACSQTDAASEGSHSAAAAVLRRSSPKMSQNHRLDNIAAQSDRIGCSTLRKNSRDINALRNERSFAALPPLQIAESEIT